MQTKIRIGIIVLAVSAILGLVMAVIWPQSSSQALQPVRSVSERTELPVPSTTTTEALRSESLPVTTLPTNSSTTKPDRQIVKPDRKAVKPSTSTTQFKAESKNMADVKTPLQVAETYVGKPNQWGPNWCAKFVSWSAEQAGVPNWTSRPGPSALWADAMKTDRVHPLPKVGDMGFADLRDPSTRAEYDTQVMHVFIVSAVNGDEYSTVEGNFDDTQLVVRNTRHVSDGFTIAFASFPS